MVPMTDRKMDGSPIQFYDSFANEYDELTGFAEHFNKERSTFQMLVQKYDRKIVLDVGCGTGFHSILLAQLGMHMTSVEFIHYIK